MEGALQSRWCRLYYYSALSGCHLAAREIYMPHHFDTFFFVLSWGASIYYVRVFGGFFEPPTLIRKGLVARSVPQTASWELWKHPDPVPGGRPMFFKAKLPKKYKNGFKTISCRCYPVMFFSKFYFRHQKSSKKMYVLLIFEFLWQYIWIN